MGLGISILREGPKVPNLYKGARPNSCSLPWSHAAWSHAWRSPSSKGKCQKGPMLVSGSKCTNMRLGLTQLSRLVYKAIRERPDCEPPNFPSCLPDLESAGWPCRQRNELVTPELKNPADGPFHAISQMSTNQSLLMCSGFPADAHFSRALCHDVPYRRPQWLDDNCLFAKTAALQPTTCQFL